MTINWHNLRPWNGSQHLAFEELCSQLAAAEQPCAGAQFFRKGTPDAGVECFWRLPNGEEYGWQAKFFLAAPNPGQWRQLDKSVESALKKHPSISRYTVCLPIDRSDARAHGKQSFLDKWHARVAKWQNTRRKSKGPIVFEYWGEHELFLRLTRDEHRGRRWFWLDGRQFSTQWFRRALSDAIANAGGRYTPELNVKLPVAEFFEALGRTRYFFDQYVTIFKDLKKVYSPLLWRLEKHADLEQGRALLESRSTVVFETLNTTFLDSARHPWENLSCPINWTQLNERARAAIQCCENLGVTIRLLQDKIKRTQTSQEPPRITVTEPYREESYYLFEFRNLLDDLSALCTKECAELTNRAALLMVGDAGHGKTHLFCDVAEQGLSAGRPRILLHGGHFQNSEPWSQIITELGLSCDRQEFLGALEAAAQASKCRLLILIDALNEGEGRYLWKKYLAGMLVTLTDYPWLGVAFSVRSSYESLVVDAGPVGKRLVRVEHSGFHNREYEAAQRFFDYYGIQPTIPLLHPEFRNPLFLKLLCSGVKNRGLTQVPVGLHGITALLNFFLDATNQRLAERDRLDYDPKDKLVQAAVEKVIAVMAARGCRTLPRTEAANLIDSLRPVDGYEHSLFRQLIAESILSEDRWKEDGRYVECVRFTYERFVDHLIVTHYLNKYLDKRNPQRAFSKKRKLGMLFKDELATRRQRGLIEALSIQLPEWTGKELHELVPHAATFEPVIRGYIESIVWRSRDAFFEKTNKFINSHIINNSFYLHQFLDALLTIAPVPGHPHNADSLHRFLLKFPLPERDRWWTTFIHHQWRAQQALDRMVEWASNRRSDAAVPEEAIRLTGLAMAWFLASANRYLRDCTTKSMVRLFEGKISVFRELLATFSTVDDPYVQERLFAVAYGCSLRCADTATIAGLARDVYDMVFKHNPTPHVLLRDYASGVVERALSLGANLNVDYGRIRPPYKSKWPGLKIPTMRELESWRWREGLSDVQRPAVWIYNQVMGDWSEDFSRYVIGDLREWSRDRIGQPRKITHDERERRFVASLTERQRVAWNEYESNEADLVWQEVLDVSKKRSNDGARSAAQATEPDREVVEARFMKTLRKGSKKAREYREFIKPYRQQPSK